MFVNSSALGATSQERAGTEEPILAFFDKLVAQAVLDGADAVINYLVNKKICATEYGFFPDI